MLNYLRLTFQNLRHLVAQEVLKNWKISFGTWNSILLAARVPDADKLNITTMYLTGDAKLWWRTQTADDVSAGLPRIDTWDKLIKEMCD